ncbi:MAG: hypothetical protein B7733_06725 [Myxococcales bacterium FL481]|nr:MAG: hypothetical protein B7733_06725 [Myxococcales bacterium FL481]
MAESTPASRNLAPLAVVAILCLAGFVLLSGELGRDTAPSSSSSLDGPIVVEPGSCSSKLNRAKLDESLDLGVKFLLAHQRDEGNFDYEYDWIKKTYTPGDSQVRQAGAAWGLALIYHDNPSPEVAAALDQALGFFERHSATTEDGARFIRYPGDKTGSLGTVALVALAHIDYLRGGENTLPAERTTKLRAHLDEYLKFLLSARQDEGRFHAKFSVDDGTPRGRPSPYFDGEALLAMTKAARYLGRDDLRDIVRQEADAGYQLNNVEARRKDPDSNTTKGYYQWSSMVYFELATSGWDDVRKYGDWLIELADWMIDTHRTLKRARNTAYAYEGIVPAYQVAALRGDRAHAEKFACTMEKGLAKLTSWQLGHSLANTFIREHNPTDPEAIGGIQNHRKEAPLRIDVTQHQMHAVILARRYYWTK